jgi:hypothetical protein
MASPGARPSSRRMPSTAASGTARGSRSAASAVASAAVGGAAADDVGEGAAAVDPELPAGAQAQTKWDLPAAYPATNFHTENLVQFAGRRRQGHRRQAQDHRARQCVAVQGAGDQARGAGRAGADRRDPAGNFQNEWQIFGADGLPFLADSYDEAAKLYKAQKPLLEKKLGEQGMMLLYAVPWPPQGIYAKKPINSAADLKGVKWRAYSPATARIAELVGAQPVTVQAAELSQAMATGRGRELHVQRLHRLSTPRPTSTSSTGMTPRPGCPRTRSSSTRPPSTRWTSQHRTRC